MSGSRSGRRCQCVQATIRAACRADAIRGARARHRHCSRGDGQDPSREISRAADRFNELLEIKDLGQLKARLAEEVTGLRQLAEERQRQWRHATEQCMARVAVLETQLAGVREEASLDPLTKIGTSRTR